MSAPTRKSKKTRTSSSRPENTSAIAQPALNDAWATSMLSSFSDDAQYFAFASLAVDRHRLRVFDTNANHVIYEDTIDRAKVTCLTWVKASLGTKTSSPERSEVVFKKRRGQDTHTVNGHDLEAKKNKEDLVVLGLEDGSILIHSAAQGRLVRTLSHPSSKAAIRAVSRNAGDSLWASGSDSCLRLWDILSGNLLSAIEGTEKRTYTSLSTQSITEGGQSRLLAGCTKIDLYTASTDASSSSESGSSELELSTSFNGHATPVRCLRWDYPEAKRFASAAEDDRLVYLWELPEPASSKGKMIASCPLDSAALQVELASSSGVSLIATLSLSGQISLSPIPRELVASSTKSSSKHQVPTLHPCTTARLTTKASPAKTFVSAMCFVPSLPASIRVAVVEGGASVAFETFEYITDDGNFIPEINIKPSFKKLINQNGSDKTGLSKKRYNESANLAVASGSEIPHDPTLDKAADTNIDGNLDVDLAEMSLGDRLAARSGAAMTSGDVSDAEGKRGSSEKKRKARESATSIPSHSLTRTLIQALHAGDTSLLEACLSHSDEMIIKNTVARLPPQLAVPLLTACVERLGRGARGNGIKGRGGGASAQRGMALIKWIRAVLSIHSTHLMTMPDLVARLSHLYSTLTTRLTLQERLLSLSGKLDLVLAQAEIRSSHTPAPLTSNLTQGEKPSRIERQLTRYVEGESSEEENVQVEIGDEDDEGSVEDIELGNDEEENNDEEDSDDDDDKDDEESEDGNLVNGFVDDEAEENYEDEESDESE